MNLPLRIACALLYALSCYGGQSGSAAQSIPPASGAATAPAGIPEPAPTSPPASGAAPADANPADINAIKPGCDLDKPVASDASAAKPYVIGPLDVLGIQVWKDQNLSGTFDVGPDGMISLPLLGQIKADGLTQAELTRTIRGRLAGTVFECPPEVNVQVLRVNSKKFYIYGGVVKPGEYPLVSEMTVMDAFANSGGFKDFANLKKIRIQRGTKVFDFNYKNVSHGKNMEQDIKLQNGDRIFVPE